RGFVFPRLGPCGHRGAAGRVAPRGGRGTRPGFAHEPVRDARTFGDVEPLLPEHLRLASTTLLLERLTEAKGGDGVHRRDTGRGAVDPVAAPDDCRREAIRLPQREPSCDIDVAESTHG